MEIKKIIVTILSGIILCACGNSEENKTPQNSENPSTPLPAQNKVKSEISFSYKNQIFKLPSIAITDSENISPVYSFSRILTLNNHTYDETYQLKYTFLVNKLTYVVTADYNDLNSQPKFLTIDEKECNDSSCTYSKTLTCGVSLNLCQNIYLQIDKRTGYSQLNFQNAKLINAPVTTTLIDEDAFIQGTLIGELPKSPPTANPIVEEKNKYGVLLISSDTQSNLRNVSNTQYKKIQFTNHNITEIWTNMNSEGDYTYAKINNNQPTQIILGYRLWFGSIEAQDIQISKQSIYYNPINFTLNFNQAKIIDLDNAYITGSIGP